MSLGARLHGPLAVLALLLVPGCDKPTSTTNPGAETGSPTALGDLEHADTTGAEAGTAVPFADAQLFFELNTSHNDLGLQLFLDADGWKRVTVLDPQRQEIVRLFADGRLSRLGITELRFESAEPTPDEVLALFPPGQYKFWGRGVEGEPLAGTATLSHDFLPAPTLSPSNGEVVDPTNTVARWNAPGAEQVELIIAQDELGHQLDVILSGSTDRLRIPAQFLRPGREYKIEILAISENGNRTLVESTFRTRS
jgi:hypothetical protein